MTTTVEVGAGADGAVTDGARWVVAGGWVVGGGPVGGTAGAVVGESVVREVGHGVAGTVGDAVIGVVAGGIVVAGTVVGGDVGAELDAVAVGVMRGTVSSTWTASRELPHAARSATMAPSAAGRIADLVRPWCPRSMSCMVSPIQYRP